MVEYYPLDQEIVWLVQYPPECRRRALPRLLERFGRDAVAAELAKRLERGEANVVSITRARHWEQPPDKRRRPKGPSGPRGPCWAA
jgi:hypothetical protein